MARVLIVEDEAHLAGGLKFNLEAEGHRARIAESGESALKLLLPPNEPFDAVVLDVMLPGQDGFSVAAKLREAGSFIPILMLTARGRSEDVLKGFAAGADDYLPKPFDLAILLARLNGLLRRTSWGREQAPASDRPHAVKKGGADDDVFEFAGRTVDFVNLELRVNGRRFRLTLMETELLQHLIKNRGKAVSRSSILEKVWGLREDTDTRAIDNFIVRLRRYIEADPANPRHLLTVRGVGYRFVAAPGA